MGVLEVVAKVYEADEEAGAALVELVVYDYLTDLAKAYRPAYDAVIGPWALDRVQVAKRQLARGYVSKAVEGTYPEEQTQQIAKWLVGLERYLVASVAPEPVGKAFEWWSFDGERRQQSVSRDARGRFARAIEQDPSRVSRNPAGMSRDSIHPQVRAYVDDAGVINPGNLPAGQDPDAFAARAQFAQGQWQQAEKFVGELQRGLPKGVKDEAEAVLWVKNEETNSLRSIRIPLKDVKNGHLPNLGSQIPQMSENLSHIEIAPGADASRNTHQQIAALNMLGSTGSEAAIGVAMTDRAKWNSLASAMNVDPKSRDTKLTRFFHQMAAGGSVMSGVPGAQQFGRFAQFVGEMGPEAEKVLGPYVQRAAYRYRGTETTPDKNLVRMFNSGEMRQVDAIAAGEPVPDEAYTAATAIVTGDRRARGLASPLMTDAAFRSGQGLKADSLKMQVRSDMAVGELMQTLPKDPIIARLSEKSGSILPSQGFLFDADGKLVSQAVGHADDHYLPFDLKNLGALRGGQYVRTRQSGGLTGEDIYTAVTMGARMVTVVSPSGVYTLEMAPDFRGARSMSDKARGMYDRYLKILDAVDGSGEYLEDIPAAERMKIEQDVRALRLDKDRTKEMIEERTNEAREKATRLTPEQIDALEADVLADKYNGVSRDKLRGGAAREFEADLADAVEAEQSKLANKLRLNGQGYQVALMTLKQQHPYFIKAVRYEPLNDTGKAAGISSIVGVQGVKGRQFAGDSGYVRPGGLKAESTREGFYRTAGERQFKQDKGGSQGAASPAAAPAKETVPAGGEKAPGEPAAASEPAPNIGVVARVRENSKPMLRDAEKSLKALHDAFDSLPDDVIGQNRTGGTAHTDIDSVPQGDKTVEWLVSSTTAQLSDAIGDPSQRMKILSSLADKESVTRVFNRRMAQVNGEDHFAEKFTFGGQTNLEDAVKWTVGEASRAADSMLLLDPVSGQDAVGPGQFQAPTVDPAISAITDKAQLQAYAQDNPLTWNAAVDLATAPGEDRYNSLTEVASRARKSIKAISGMADLKAEVTREESAGRSMNFDRASMEPEEIRSALGLAPDQAITVPAVMDFQEQDALRQVKMAWQLAATGRMLEFLDGGDVFPKDWGQRWLVAKARRGRVRVLSPDDPLSKAVAARVAKGMPHVPSRRASSRSWTRSTPTRGWTR